MIIFEKFIKQIENEDLDTKKISEVLYAFCSEELISDKDITIFNYYVGGKKQREISLIFNMHQPLVSRSINISKNIFRSVHEFLFNDITLESVLLAKHILSTNEYVILNYRLVGYSFRTIAKKLNTTVQYIGLANSNIVKKLRHNAKNDLINHLVTYLVHINKHWSK